MLPVSAKNGLRQPVGQAVSDATGEQTGHRKDEYQEELLFGQGVAVGFIRWLTNLRENEMTLR
jgi:hypothetical protein